MESKEYVQLCDMLKRCGIRSRKNPGGVGTKYGTSLRNKVAIDLSRDIILAYMQNGELLTPDHGFPVRVISRAEYKLKARIR
ncbi:hypothetical protein ACFX13_041993 [Malus domestica]